MPIRIAVVAGDGIGPEVIAQALRVVDAAVQRTGEAPLQWSHFPWGSDYCFAHGRMMPADGIDQLRPFDAKIGRAHV